jgi:hypothetical protein
MRILVTSSRLPFALDMVRKLAARGHDVYASDSYEVAPGSHSRYLAGHFVTELGSRFSRLNHGCSMEVLGRAAHALPYRVQARRLDDAVC